MPKIKLPKSIEGMIPFVLIVICVVAARFIDSEILVLAVFIVTLGIYAWRKYDSRMLVGTAIFLLVVCAALLASGSDGQANDVAIWAYYFLVVGVLGLFIEYLREGHEN
jgi:DMSO/TMAO reductase YedYZ heme-binding membrane subunit